MLKEFDKRLQHDKLITGIREESDGASPAIPIEPESSTRPAKTFSSIIKQNAAACEEFDNLTSFYTSLRGQGWKNNKRWESSPDRQGILPPRFGVVFKVTKDASGEPVSQRVEEIDLSDNHINGELPADLCFSGLRRFVLKMNHISRRIPTSIGNLHLLEVIDLSYNNLSGPIPESISGKNLPALQILNLNDNKLSSSIPESLGSLKSLIELKLSHNLFSGPVPKQLSALSRLKSLDLCLNQIEGELPELFGSYFREMRYLDLSSNFLDGILPSSFSSMNQLTYLDISQNQFKSGLNLNKTIMGLTSLTELNISKNQFSGNIPSCIARFLDLRSLDLCNNYFEGPMPLGIITFQQRRGAAALRIAENNSLLFPVNLGILSLGITELALGGVGLRGEIPSALCDLTNLRVLELPDNFFTGSIPLCYSSLSNLEVLDLSKNAVSGGFHKEFSFWTKLRHLDMHGNKEFFAAFPQSFSQLISLDFIDFADCSTKSKLITTSFTENKDNYDPWWVPVSTEDFKKARAITTAICKMGNCSQCGEPSGLDSIGNQAFNTHLQISAAPHKVKNSTREDILLQQFADEDLSFARDEALQESDEDPGIIHGDIGSFPEIPTSPGTRPCDAKDAKNQGDDAFAKKDYENAINKFTDAMMFGGVSESILVDRANCLIACSRPRAAIADCTVALDLNRHSARAFRSRGVAYRLLGFWEEANADISAGQHINYETGFDDLQVFLNHKVARIESIRNHQRAIEEKRKLLLEQVRKLDNREISEKRRKGELEEEFEGYTNFFLYFNFRGDPAHLDWIGDHSIALSNGILKLARNCSHNLYSEYLTSLDISGHRLSNDGLVHLAKTLRTNDKIVILKFGSYGLDFDLTNKKSAKWHLFQPFFDSEDKKELATLNTKRERYFAEIRNSKQIKILGLTLYARPQLILGKLDINGAYIGESNRMVKLYSIVDMSSFSAINETCLVHSKIRLSFIIAFIMEDNCFTWVDAIQKFDFDLWFTLLTASKEEIFFHKAKTLASYLEPVCSTWEDNIANKVDILVSTYPDLLIFARDQFGNRAIDIAQKHFKVKMEDKILLRGRYLIDALSHALVTPIYRSDRSVIVAAVDRDVRDCYGGYSKVAIKFFANSLDYLGEVVARKRWLLDGNFVVPILDAFSPDNYISTNTSFYQLPYLLNISDCHNKPFIVMPLAQMDLKSFITSSSICAGTDESFISILCSLWKCLEYFHSRGVVHGNLDPSNVVIVGKQCKLIDMDTVTPIGSPFSIFIEQNLNGDSVVSRTDTKRNEVFIRVVPSFLPPEFISIQSQRNLMKLRSRQNDSSDKQRCRVLLQWLEESQNAYSDLEARQEDSILSTDVKFGSDASIADLLLASPSFDMWQFGCILYFYFIGSNLMNFSQANMGYEIRISSSCEIKSLFELGTWRIDNSESVKGILRTNSISYIRKLILVLMRDLLSLDPSNRLKYNLKRFEEKICEEDLSLTYRIEDTSSGCSVGVEVSHCMGRRTYYIKEFQSSALLARLTEILTILGRISSSKTEDSIILFSSSASPKETEIKSRIRSLKHIIASEQNDYPTSIRLRLPNKPSSLKEAVESFKKFIFPVLARPTQVNPLYCPASLRSSDIANHSSTLNCTYIYLDLVCEVCFKACQSQLWPIRVSLLPDDKIFLDKISPIANATFRAASEAFASKLETPDGKLCEAYDGQYIEGIGGFIGYEDYRSAAADARCNELELLQSYEAKSLRSLLNQASSPGESEKRSGDYRLRCTEENQSIESIRHLVIGLEPKIMQEASVRTKASFVSGHTVYDIVSPPKSDAFDVMDSRIKAEFEDKEEKRGMYLEVLGKRSGKGFSSREFCQFLAANDPDKDWGGLKRVVLPSGLSMWMCGGCFLRISSEQGQIRVENKRDGKAVNKTMDD